MNKKELIDSIVAIDKSQNKVALNKKTLKELEQILKNIEGDESAPKVSVVDIEKEMYERVKKELEEKMKAEMTVESLSNKKVRKEIDRFATVPVMNVTKWALTYFSKRTGAEWNWEQFGDVIYIEVQELMTMRSSQRRFIDEPWLLILDEDVVEYLGLTKMYSKINLSQVENFESIFNLEQDEFEDAVNSFPKGIQQSLVQHASELWNKGVLDSRNKTNFLNEKFGSDIGFRG